MMKYATAANIFVAVGLILSHAMCAHVAFEYCNMHWGAKYEGHSAPASVAFFIAIPYLLIIAAIFIVAVILMKKSKNPV